MSSREVKFWYWLVERLPKKLIYFSVVAFAHACMTEKYRDKHLDEVPERNKEIRDSVEFSEWFKDITDELLAEIDALRAENRDFDSQRTKYFHSMQEIHKERDQLRADAALTEQLYTESLNQLRADFETAAHKSNEYQMEAHQLLARVVKLREALKWITEWGDIHDIHGRKAYGALAADDEMGEGNETRSKSSEEGSQ